MSEPDEPSLPWPSSRRKIFEVSEHANRLLNADVRSVTDRPQRGLFALVEGYRLAADAIYERAVSSRRSTEYFIWPLVYVWRHQLEIALKLFVAFGRTMKGEPWSFAPSGRSQPNHKLLTLWTEVREVIMRSGNVPPGDELDEVGRRVDEFDKMDPDSFGFRYTTNRSNTERALSEPPGHINLGDFHEAMSEVGNFLKAAYEILFEQHQRELEQQLELERR